MRNYWWPPSSRPHRLYNACLKRLVDDLTALETSDNESLWRVMKETVSPETLARIGEFLERGQRESLTSAEQDQLAFLQREANLVLLRKARAGVFLRFRGQRLPTCESTRIQFVGLAFRRPRVRVPSVPSCRPAPAMTTRRRDRSHGAPRP
jgi:hypothetical protein